MNKGKLYLVLFSIFVLSSILAFDYAFAGITLGGIINLSNDSGDSKLPTIFSAGSKVYVVWNNSTVNTVSFTNSTNDGVSFYNDVSIGSTNTGGTAATSPDPEVAANGDNVYVVWQDNNIIKLRRSTNNAGTFLSEQSISSTANADATQDGVIRVNSTQNFVHVAWVDSSDRVRFSASNDNGATFGLKSEFDVGSISTTTNMDMAVSSGNVHIIRKASPDIFMRTSTDGGANFGSDIDLGTTSGIGSGLDIDAIGSKVYAVWRHGTSLKFANTTTSVTTYDPEITLGTIGGSTPPKIKADSSGNVYVVWEQGGAIKFIRSTNSGDSFESEQTLVSGTTSSQPDLSISGNTVYVTWKQGATDDFTVKLLQNESNGASGQWSGSSDLSVTTSYSEFPQITSSGIKTHVVWEERTDNTATDREVKINTVTKNTVTVSYDKSSYRLSETATITITSSASDTTSNADTIQATVSSTTTTSDGSGNLSLTFTETGTNTGQFRATVNFSTSASSGTTLKVKPGDTITTTFSAVSGNANIYSRTFTFDASQYSLNSLANLIVTDQNSNTNQNAKDTVTVTITAKSGGTTSLTLTETTNTSGIFGTTSDNSIVFMNGNFNVPLGRTITITQLVTSDADTIPNPVLTAGTDTMTMKVTSTTDPTTGVTITLTETGVTNITGGTETAFTGQLTVSSSASAGTNLLSSACDILTFTPQGTNYGLPTKGFVSGCTDSTKTSLVVSVTSGTPDLVNATLGITKSSNVSVRFDAGESGGGGGGLVRPTIVVNALAALPIFGGGGNSDTTAPIATLDSITKLTSVSVPDNIKKIIENQKPNVPIEPLENEPFDLPLSINEKGYPLGSDENTIVTNNLNVGQTVKFKTVFYEQTDLEHVSMYMNIRDGQRDDKSDTYILFNKRSPLEVIDRNGFFDKVNFEIIVDKHNKKTAVFEITFAKPMETSDLIYKSWDFERRGTTVQVRDAINIELPPSEKVEETITPEPVNTKSPVPDWIKNNVGWWADGQIDDKTFTNGIGFLISEKILDVPVGPNVSKIKTDDPELVEEEPKESTVPDWVKNNAKWWAAGQIDEDTFLSGIEYLVKHEIIIVSNS